MDQLGKQIAKQEWKEVAAESHKESLEHNLELILQLSLLILMLFGVKTYLKGWSGADTLISTIESFCCLIAVQRKLVGPKAGRARASHVFPSRPRSQVSFRSSHVILGRLRLFQVVNSVQCLLKVP